MVDDPIWSEYEADFKEQPKPFTVIGDNGELIFRAARLPDPETIPPRPWLYGTQLLRGYVSVLVAPGGVGKTGYAMGVALSLASGRPLFGEKIFEPVKVAVLNLEDPMDELERRLAALMIHHRVPRPDIEGQYFLYSSDDRRVTVAAMSSEGYEIVHPDEAAIIREIQLNGIGLLIVDPFAESHELEENSNTEMNRAASAWRRIARVTGCAILLIHHVRKGAVVDIDAARGAKALTDSARVGLLLSPMSEADAAEFDISAEDRPTYVRLDDAKANMAPKAGVARWFKLETIELHNATKSYPAGDRVAAIARWYAPSVMGDLTVVQCNLALDTIAHGPREGVKYTAHRTGKSNRWAGQVLVDMFAVGEKRAGLIVNTWLRNGVLEVRDYEDPEQRKPRAGLLVVDAKRPGNGFD